jgi:hypothetical protein
MTNSIRVLVLALIVLSVRSQALAITPDNPGPADVQFTVNAGQNVRAISPHIYGINFYENAGFEAPATLDRLGGNRWSGYNWETNASNAGSDWNHQSDNYLVENFASNTPPGEAVRPSLVSAAQNNRALVVTVPMAGYVAADVAGPVSVAQTAPSSRWHQVAAKKSSVYPGSSLSLVPNESDNYVFTDEFVNWFETTREQQSSPPEVFYSLDNEPALWSETHSRLHPNKPTFVEMKARTIAHASAIKDVAPDAMVLGAVSYGYSEFTTLQDATDRTTSPAHPGGDQNGENHYLEWLLKEVRTEELAQGRKLMDVLDVHWYPEAMGGGTRIAFDNNPNPSAGLIEARIQAPRSLWDPTYAETSWISQWGTWQGSPGNYGPVTLLPRLQRDINDFNPGTKLSITEYNYGGGAHISGGIAQADALGVFGREGLFAAALWPIDGSQAFTDGAFQMYLDYDGQGGQFGDTSINASTNNIAQSAVYASVDSEDPSRMILVAINRTNQPLDAGLAVTSDLRFDRAEVFQLTSASASPQQAADIDVNLVNAFQYTMPAYSVSTLVLYSASLPGDFDNDGDVDGRDFLAWQRNPNLGDLADWQSSYNGELLIAGTAIPEPKNLYQFLVAICIVMFSEFRNVPRFSHLRQMTS